MSGTRELPVVRGYAPRRLSNDHGLRFLPGRVRSGHNSSVIDRIADRIGLGAVHEFRRTRLAITTFTPPGVSSTLSMSLSCLRLLLVAPPKLFRRALSFRRVWCLRVFARVRAFSTEAVKNPNPAQVIHRYSPSHKKKRRKNSNTPPRFDIEIEYRLIWTVAIKRIIFSISDSSNKSNNLDNWCG